MVWIPSQREDSSPLQWNATNGILKKEDTGGIDLCFGNKEAMIRMVEMIGNREGLGDILAEEIDIAAKKFGKGAEPLAMHVKGMPLPFHEPRGKTRGRSRLCLIRHRTGSYGIPS